MTRMSALPAMLIRIIAVLAIAMPLAAPAAENLDARVAAANNVLQELQAIPEQEIPPNLLNRAYALVVIPNVVKVGLMVGGSYGKGVMLVRQADGSWSNPAFVKLANMGLGWQLGVQDTDLVLVFKNQRGVENIARGKFTLGGSASAAAGPVGRTAQAMTDGEFKSEIYAYSRSRGAFAGVSVDGGAITIDQPANAAFYGESKDATASSILNDRSIATPAAAAPLLATLGKMAPSIEWQSPAPEAAPAPATTPENGSKTFPVDDTDGTASTASTAGSTDTANPAPETQF